MTIPRSNMCRLGRMSHGYFRSRNATSQRERTDGDHVGCDGMSSGRTICTSEILDFHISSLRDSSVFPELVSSSLIKERCVRAGEMRDFSNSSLSVARVSLSYCPNRLSKNTRYVPVRYSISATRLSQATISSHLLSKTDIYVPVRYPILKQLSLRCSSVFSSYYHHPLSKNDAHTPVRYSVLKLLSPRHAFSP